MFVSRFTCLLLVLFHIFACKRATIENAKPLPKQKESEIKKKPETLSLESLALTKKDRSHADKLVLSDVKVEEYALVSKKGRYYAPALTFEVQGGEPDYYEFRACLLNDSSKCINGSFGEDGEALCGVEPGTYTFELKACFDSVWNSSGGCSSSFKAKNSFGVKESTDLELADRIKDQCKRRADIRKKATTLYYEMSKWMAGIKIDPSNIHAQNCSVIGNQINDWGPQTFAHRVGYHGVQFSKVAAEQYEQSVASSKQEASQLALTRREDRFLIHSQACNGDPIQQWKFIQNSSGDKSFRIQNLAMEEQLCLGKQFENNSISLVDCHSADAQWQTTPVNSTDFQRFSLAKHMSATSCLKIAGQSYLEYSKECDPNDAATHWKLHKSGDQVGVFQVKNKFHGDYMCYVPVKIEGQSVADWVRGIGDPETEKLGFFAGMLYIGAGALTAFMSVSAFYHLYNPYKVVTYELKDGEIKKVKTETISKAEWQEYKTKFSPGTGVEAKNASLVADADFIKGSIPEGKTTISSFDNKGKVLKSVSVYEGNTKKVVKGTENVNFKRAASVAGIGAAVGLAVFGAWYAGMIELTGSSSRSCLSNPAINALVAEIQEGIDSMEVQDKAIEGML